MIEISETAAKEIKRIQLNKNKPNSQLKLNVRSGGCYGLFYCLEVKSDSDKDAKYHYFESNGISVAVPDEAYSYLQGMKLDYAEDLMGGNFRFQNPNVSKTCSCGISFSPDNVRT